MKRGYVDVGSLDQPTSGSLDAAVALRRAQILRTHVLKSIGDVTQWIPTKAGKLVQRLNVDQGIVDAFLRVTSFTYGARSIEAIVKMSALKERRVYDRSSLPSHQQLSLHVDPKEFLTIVEAPRGGERGRLA